MKNLFVLEDESSDEEEEKEGGGAVRAADCQQVQPEVQDSPSDATTAPPGVVSSGGGDGQCSDTTLNTQQTS